MSKRNARLSRPPPNALQSPGADINARGLDFNETRLAAPFAAGKEARKTGKP
jgi:hypothetical protein